jgi:YHS domain-containing protein
MKTSHILGLIIIAALAIYGIVLAQQIVIFEPKCLVTGQPVDKEIFLDYQGERIYFSSETSLERFKDNPEAYLKRREPAACNSG